jgi:hypothetical protein
MQTEHRAHITSRVPNIKIQNLDFWGEAPSETQRIPNGAELPLVWL